MHVLLNATDAILNTRSIQRYVEALARGLSTLAHAEDEEISLLFFTPRFFKVQAFLKSLPSSIRPRAKFFLTPRRWLVRRFVGPRSQLRRLSTGASLYHECGFDSPTLAGIPVVTTFNGLAHWVIPEFLNPEFVAHMQAWTERAVARSRYFICVSEKTREELLSLFPVDPQAIRVIPLGVGDQFQPGDGNAARLEIAHRFGIAGRFLLYVGGIQRNKNIPLLLRVFRRLVAERGFEGSLVLVGDTHYEEVTFERMVDETGLSGRIVRLGLVHSSDPTLPLLYRAASLFLFPSYYEGWTSPPLEAMGCGTPVVASDASSIPETVGDAALLAHPDDDDRWLEACAELLEDSPLRARCVERGLARASLFPWTRTVAATWGFYRDIAGGIVTQESRAPGIATPIGVR